MQRYIAQSLGEIGPMVLHGKDNLKFHQCIFAISL
mgnify:CR=1 FL=1